MVSFVNACVFKPTAAGVGDFVVSTAVPGWQTPAQAGATNGAIYRYRAAVSDGSEWEIGTGTYTSGTVTLSRTTILASSTGGVKVSFSQPPDITLTAFAMDVNNREFLFANRDYYVRTDGNDANTGLVNSAGGAFLTIQRAIDTVATLDRSVHTVNINVGSGTFTGLNVVNKWGPGGGPVNIIGAGIAATTINTVGSCFITGDRLHVQDVRMTNTTSGSCLRTTLGGFITWGLVDFGPSVNPHIWIEQASRGQASSNYTISGSATSHVFARYAGASLEIFNRTITVTGTPAFVSTFCSSASTATIEFTSCTFVGSATGPRYSAVTNSVINTGGGGATYFPGDSVGSVATGGQYV